MTAALEAPRSIAGGFLLVPVVRLISAWHACRKRPLGVADFRTWLAAHEMVARRCRLGDGRSPAYSVHELARLTGVTTRRVSASVDRLAAAGLLAFSDHLIDFPDPPPLDDALARALDDTIGRGRGPLAIPRRILRLIAGGARPALIATALATLLRCLSRSGGGFRSRGRLKASFVAALFGVDLRRVKQARKDLIALGWIAPEPSGQSAMNRWGAPFRIDLGWDRAATAAGARLPPPPDAAGARLPPPDLQTEIPSGRVENQEPAPGGPAGVEARRGESDEVAIRPGPPVPATPSSPSREGPEPDRGQRAGVEGGAGGGPPPPRLADVRVEDLRDTGRLLELHGQAVSSGLIGPSEADLLRFVSAAEHARSIGSRNVPGLFAWLIRGRRWGYLTQDDEDAASGRLKRHLFGAPRPIGAVAASASASERPRLSEDARLVREVKAALARAGYRGDPFPMVRARDRSWTRERWDAASGESGGARGGP